MRILILFSCLLLNCINSLAFEKKYPVSAIPEALKENAKAVMRVDDGVFTIISAGKARFQVKQAFTILNKEADDLGRLVIYYDKFHSINYIRGTVYNALGEEVNKLKKSDIRDISAGGGVSFVDDARLKIAELSHTQYPYTVEFEYEEEYNSLATYPNWYWQSRPDVSVESSTFKIITSKNFTFRYQELNFDKIQSPDEQSTQSKEDNLQKSIQKVKISQQGENTVYSWQASHLSVFKTEAFGPPHRELIPMIQLAPNEFEFGGYKGNMQTWESYGKFQLQLNQGRDELSEATKAKLNAMVASLPSKAEKVKKIYEYLQSKTRYVGIQLGIGGWQPFPATYVDEKGYGDCKALSNYTYAMLKAVGIESFYTLVGAGKDYRPVNRNFPADQFNHIILCVPNQKDTIWLECTSQTDPVGYQGEFTGDRDVLLITPQGGKLVHTTTYRQKDNLLNRLANIKIDANGDVYADISTNYRALQEGVRSFLVEESKEDQKKWLYEHLDIPSFDIQEFSLTRQKDRLPITTEKLKLQITKYASKSGKRMFIPLNLLNRWDRVPEANPNRKSEVYLSGDYDFIDVDTLQYQLPEGYEVEYQPEPIQIKSKFGEYQITCKKEGNVLTYVRKLEMNRGKFPKEAYNELIEFFKNIAKNDKTKLVLVNKG